MVFYIALARKKIPLHTRTHVHTLGEVGKRSVKALAGSVSNITFTYKHNTAFAIEFFRLFLFRQFRFQ